MKQKFYNVNKIDKLNAQYNIVLGERSNGKSYAIKHLCIKQAYENPETCKFIYLRRWDVEIKMANIESYFADVNYELITGGKYQGIVVYQKGIYFAVYDEKSQRLVKQLHIGYARALSHSEHYKSGVYTDCSNIIYEEFISRTSYISNEPNRLQDFVSTVARRNLVKVWLIGNSISRVCPYFSEWELLNIPKQKPGTIDIYSKVTDQLDEEGNNITVKIAVEFAENSGNNSKMFFGESAKMITTGAWQSDNVDKLPKKFKEYEELYVFVFRHKGFKFLCRYLYDEKKDFTLWFICPKTTEIQKNTRVVSDTPISSSLATRTFVPKIPGELPLFKSLATDHLYFSDNLTGADFYTCFAENMKKRQNF